MKDELTGWAKSVVLSDGYYPTDEFLWAILDDPEGAEARARFIWRLNPPPDHSLRACVSALLRAEMTRLRACAEKAEALLAKVAERAGREARIYSYNDGHAGDCVAGDFEALAEMARGEGA